MESPVTLSPACSTNLLDRLSRQDFKISVFGPETTPQVADIALFTAPNVCEGFFEFASFTAIFYEKAGKT